MKILIVDDQRSGRRVLKQMLAALPDVEILEFNAAGTKLVVRPYCHNDHYWQVYFDTNKAIAEVGGANGWPIPAPHQVLRQPG